MPDDMYQQASAEQAPAAPALLTLSGVARLLAISRRQVYRLLTSGRLPSADVCLGQGPRGRRWRRDLLKAWIRAGCPSAASWRAWLSQRHE